MTYYAAIDVSPTGRVLIVARKHVFHHNRDAALRAIERAAKRMFPDEDRRGFIWPTSEPSALTDEHWDKIEAIAL